MLTNILLGTLMMLVTTLVHSIFMVITFYMLEFWSTYGRREKPPAQLTVVSATILLLFAAAFVEVAMWAGAYLAVGAINGLETSLYFSMVTFTTLGYGDIVLTEQWRLLGAIEAANGIIMFGWSTALVIAVVQRTFASLLRRIHERRSS